MHHDVDATTLKRTTAIAAGAALAAVLVIAPTKARHETAKARHDAMHPVTATR
jgi:hypothetical protein